ncbi:isoprenoid synthase domain-containing protein [Rhodocollybia butyracea]|uniref:Terpene synthase n=1 Tax=Rhodocollybia butyracea TaxID=206335 RepID=A0A9P5PE05_9AGAR|nr:isoprenoid synthase domain-containing protein [Rhodocollybia butyracea]
MSIFLGKSVFPPARQHPRRSELLKDSEEYFLKRWPFETEAARQHFCRSILADYVAKTVPDTEHWEKLVFAARAVTWAFLLDDMVEVKATFKSMPDLLQVIYGNKKPNPDLYWEVVTDDIWRGIQRGCTAVEFDQMTCTVKEWYISHGQPIPDSFDGWLIHRHHDCGANWVWAFSRYAMECRVTDEDLTHPAVRKAEDSAAVTCFLVNDIVSFPKDKMDNREELNGVSMIRKYGLASTEEQALDKISDIIVQRTRQFTESINQALADPTLSSDMKQWMMALPYAVSGNSWWGQLTARYNFPGLPAPRMTINMEGQGDIIEPAPFADLEFDKLVDGVPFPVQKANVPAYYPEALTDKHSTTVIE